jgi:hypothetical protein
MKIKNLKTNKKGEYINKDLTTFLEAKDIIYDLIPPYSYETNSLPKYMNQTITMIV